jgi:homogentisate 1,2-dioxygenase
VPATELSWPDASPGEIAVVPRGRSVVVALPDGAVLGFVRDNRGAIQRLPELGPIGTNSLANRSTS